MALPCHEQHLLNAGTTSSPGGGPEEAGCAHESDLQVELVGGGWGPKMDRATLVSHEEAELGRG